MRRIKHEVDKDRPSSSPGPGSPSGTSQIDDHLRRVYQPVMEEGVPDRFQRLIEQLRQQDTRGTTS